MTHGQEREVCAELRRLTGSSNTLSFTSPTKLSPFPTHSYPQIIMANLKKQKLSVQLRRRENHRNAASAACTTPPCSFDQSSTTPNVPHISDLTNLTYEEYKAFDLSSTQQHDLIGEIRAELPLVDAHEVDNWLLDSLEKQLSTCIFPIAKMMHIDPVAMKRMLDTEFRKAYGQDAEASIIERERQRAKRNDSATTMEEGQV
jgi:hypothetical protein